MLPGHQHGLNSYWRVNTVDAASEGGLNGMTEPEGRQLLLDA